MLSVQSEVKLYLGDCLEILPTLADNSVDAVITDLPYGLNIDYGIYEDTPENLKKLIFDFLPIVLNLAKNTIITCGVTNLWLYPQPDWVLSWQYPNGNTSGIWGFRTWQPVLIYGRDPKLANKVGRYPDSVTTMILPTKKRSNGHPTQKPMRFMKWIIERCSMPGDTILDPFMGSGTTGVACVRTGRNFIGIEIEPKYFEIAEKRIKEAQMQLRMPF